MKNEYKPGQKVFTVTTTAIQEWFFAARDGRYVVLTGEYRDALQYDQRDRVPRIMRGYFRQSTQSVASTYRGAVQLRIEMLEKSIRTMQTTIRSHRSTIWELKTKLEE